MRNRIKEITCFAAAAVSCVTLSFGCLPAVQTVLAAEADYKNAVRVNLDEEKEQEGITRDGQDVIISEAGIYQLSGTLEGKLTVSTSKKEEVTLILDGVHIENAADEALDVRKTGKLTIVLADESENVIISGVQETQPAEDAGAGDSALVTVEGTEEEDDASGGAMHLHTETIITGSGSLAVFGYLNNGIQCTKDLTIESGSIEVEAAHHAVKTKKDLEIQGGELSLKAGADGIHTGKMAEETTEDTSDTGNGIAWVQEAAPDAGEEPVGNVTEETAEPSAEKETVGNVTEETAEPSAEKETAAEGETDTPAESDAAVEEDADQATGSISISNAVINIESGSDGIQAGVSIVQDSGEIRLDCQDEGIRSGGSIELRGGTINATCQGNGILADGNIELAGANISVDCYRDAIQARGDLIVQTGNIILKTEGNYKRTGGGGFGGGRGESDGRQANTNSNSEKGLKADGSITINGGTITFDTVDDAVHCAEVLTIEDGNLTIICGDDGLHSDRELVIGGGTVDIQQAYEGIEANQITVAGGDVSMVTSDDGFNANGGSGSGGGSGNDRGNSNRGTELPHLMISGGSVYVNSTGDGLDSNGSITVSGGYTVVDGPTSDFNGPLDSGMENGGKLLVTGGTIFAAGASGMAETFENQSTQCSFMVTFSTSYRAGTEFIITAQNGEELLRHTAASSGTCFVFSSPELQQGDTCTLTIIAGEKEYNFDITPDRMSSKFRINGKGEVQLSSR